MTSNYYDLDDILADGEKVPSRFNMTVPGLGYLEGNPGKAVQKGTQLELPMWLAEVLAICAILEDSQESFIDLSEPEFISSRVLNAIKTNPRTVDLRKLLRNYYKLVEKWGTFFNEPSLIEIIMTMLKERAFEINNFASNTNKLMNNDFTYTLDEFERILFRMTSDSNKQMRNWLKE
ncbi:DNA replication complex GINS protein PSF3 [Suhomyces tanzawaensis NRRL Y-17324]|uniref:DNA replication complex GINS protein PSF3 n=1 Tax=Suhomyces tanzawaensis NRRL Y-17324 TaxID=984487 RepID=A0A1E4SSA4_9ASCO|nr:DNA replication complex GINS protein PSF3 [Suhomyces tanzawaensis NRRL Y-17324]ODV82297.1 DNA replication complex GINS protein PSF3 [Suhomyces tanzawaensis NRRL Y-17324]